MSTTVASAPRPTRAPCPGPCAGLCDEDGFAAAYRTYRPRLLGWARGSLGDRELAEDAVQEAFSRAWRACASFDPSAGPPLITWLFTVTRNVVIDFARARSKRPGPAWSDPVDAAERPTGETSAIDSALLRMVLLDALNEVSDDHRGIVLRTVVHDRAYADVAAELDLPVGTIKSRVFYALRNVRGRLDRSDLLV